MSKAALLGSEEVTIEEHTVSGCMIYAAPVILIVAGYFVRSSWGVVRGAEAAIIGDSKFLNVVVGLALLGTSLFFCAFAALVLIAGLWKTRIKFYERGLTLHGLGAVGASCLFYNDLALVHITEKHNLTADPPGAADGLPRRYTPKRDLLEVAIDALLAKKSEKKPDPPKFYENTEYTFTFTLKKQSEPVTYSIILDRADEEIVSIAERLEMEGVKVEREAEAAREKQSDEKNSSAA